MQYECRWNAICDTNGDKDGIFHPPGVFMLQIHFIKKVFCVAVVALVLLLTGGEVLAQRGHGGRSERSDRGRRQERRPDRESGRHFERRDNWDRQQRRIDQRDSREGQRFERANIRQRQMNDQNSWRRQQQISRDDSRRVWTDRRRRYDADNNRRERWRNDDNDRNDRRKRSYNNDDDDDRREHRRERREERVYYSPERIFPQILIPNNRGWYPYQADKRYRKEMKRAWKEQRRAQKRYEKQQRRYARLARNDYYDREYYDPYYGDNYYDVNDRGSNWQQLIGVLIGSVLGGNLNNGSLIGLTQRQPDYGYLEPGYAQPENRPAYYNSPLYVGNDEPYYPYEPQYAGYQNDTGFGGLLGQLPIGDLIGQFVGNDLISGMLGNFVTQGYDEGFLAGQYARENDYGDRYFDDPYEYNGMYDPYTTSLGVNRQALSQGYCSGYRDALIGREDYDPISNGNTDLVSSMLANVLGSV